MGAFEYVAMDRSGKQMKGLLEGDTPRHVRQLLRDRNLLPVSVTEVAQREARRQRSFSLRRGMSPGELALITRQLASLSQSGLPLEEALLAVAQQNDQPRTKSILLGVRSKVMEGHTLADGFSEYPQAFPELYRATVAAGEQSGHLDVVLERLADYTEARQELRQRVTNAMVYPIALVVMAVAIISFMLATVVPEDRRRLRKYRSGTTGANQRPDCDQRFSSGLLADGHHRARRCRLCDVVCAAKGRAEAAFPRGAVTHADRRPLDTRCQYGPFYPHAQYPGR